MNNNTPRRAHDLLLRRAMRIAGFLLAALACFFLTRDVGQTATAFWFFTACAGLGALLFTTSFFPSPRELRARRIAAARQG